MTNYRRARTDYSVRWGLIKPGFTKRIKGVLPLIEGSGSRKKKREGSIWQRRFWEHMIRNEEDFSLHCDYIYFNPVKHGYVATAREWSYSTFSRFVKKGFYPKGRCG